MFGLYIKVITIYKILILTGKSESIGIIPDEDYRADLQPMYLPEVERFYNRKEIDTRKLNYEYYRIDIRLAASKSNRFRPQKSPDIQDAAHEYKKADYINGVVLNDGQNGGLGSPSILVGYW